MKNKRCNTHNKMDEDKKSYIQRMQFQNAMKFKEIAVELSESISDQINLFTFMIQCIIRELEAEEISKIFYVDNNEHIKQPILSSFPEYTCCEDMTKLFPHITTDGEWWYNAHTGEKKYKVYDFRFAVLYEIARCKYELEN